MFVLTDALMNALSPPTKHYMGVILSVSKHYYSSTWFNSKIFRAVEWVHINSQNIFFYIDQVIPVNLMIYCPKTEKKNCKTAIRLASALRRFFVPTAGEWSLPREATDTVSNHVYMDDIKLYAGVNELLGGSAHFPQQTQRWVNIGNTGPPCYWFSLIMNIVIKYFYFILFWITWYVYLYCK